MIDHSDIIRLRLQTGKGLLLEVEPLMKLEFYTTVINRLYYSCFHVTTALLLTKNITAKTHKGIANMLHQQFVNNNEFEHKKAAFFGDLLNERIRDDYNEFLIMDEQEVSAFIEPSKQYVEYVTKLIETYFDAQRTTSTRSHV